MLYIFSPVIAVTKGFVFQHENGSFWLIAIGYGGSLSLIEDVYFYWEYRIGRAEGIKCIMSNSAIDWCVCESVTFRKWDLLDRSPKWKQQQ